MASHYRDGLVVTILALLVLSFPLRAQAIHTVRLDGEQTRGGFDFTPSEITARPGDILQFEVHAAAPHSIVFQAAGLSTAARAALNGAMSRRVSDLRGPLLVRTGETYRLVVPRLAPGRYPFFCLAHRAYDASGTLVIPKN